jgi:hypothetical protein
MRLKNLRIREVSIVDKGANKRRYAIIKRVFEKGDDPTEAELLALRDQAIELMAMIEQIPSTPSSAEDQLAYMEGLLAFSQRMSNNMKREAYAQRAYDDAVELGRKIDPIGASMNDEAAYRVREAARERRARERMMSQDD